MYVIKYLGHFIGNWVTRTDLDKISAVTDFPVPISVKKVRKLMGMTGWCRKFIRDYVSITMPLTDATRINRRFV